MKIIDEANKITNIILEDGDVIEIFSLHKNKEKLIIKCLNSSLHIDELSVKQIKDKIEDEKAIKVMDDYLEKNSI